MNACTETLYYTVTVCCVIQYEAIWLHVLLINALSARVLLSLQVTMALIRLLTRLSGYVHLKQGLQCLGASSQSKTLQHTAAYSSSCNYQLLPDYLGERHAFEIDSYLHAIIARVFKCVYDSMIILFYTLFKIH